MKKISIVFMALMTLSAQLEAASNDAAKKGTERQCDQMQITLSSTHMQNRREQLSPYQAGIQNMLTPFITVKSLAELTAEYVGKSDFEEYWKKSDGNLETLLKEKPDIYINSLDVDTQNPFYGPILHRVNNPEMLKKMLGLNPDLNAGDSLGKTALFSLRPKNLDVIAILVRAGADVNIKDNRGEDVFEHWSGFGCADPIKHIEDIAVAREFFAQEKQKAIAVQTTKPQCEPKSRQVKDLFSELTTESDKK